MYVCQGRRKRKGTILSMHTLRGFDGGDLRGADKQGMHIASLVHIKNHHLFLVSCLSSLITTNTRLTQQWTQLSDLVIIIHSYVLAAVAWDVRAGRTGGRRSGGSAW